MRAACLVLLCLGWASCHPIADSEYGQKTDIEQDIRPDVWSVESVPKLTSAFESQRGPFRAQHARLPPAVAPRAGASPRAAERRLFVVDSPCVPEDEAPCDKQHVYEFDLLASSD